jgi:desampylase
MSAARAITIATSVVDTILAEAEKAGSHECCGLLLGNAPGHIAIALPCANVAEEPDKRFEIDPAALLSAHKAARGGGPAILGHYHSHPNGRAEPSACDAELAGEDGQLWAIAANGALGWWITRSGGPLHDRFAPADVAVID